MILADLRGKIRIDGRTQMKRMAEGNETDPCVTDLPLVEESDEIFKKHGLEHFLQHETKNARVPMNRGPFGNFLVKLSRIRELYMRPDGISRVRIAIVTARNAPSHERVIHTLRAWGTPADEAHFVGAHEKGPILGATGAHIFFDDQEKHVLSASGIVAAGLVPGPHLPDELIIPAG